MSKIGLSEAGLWGFVRRWDRRAVPRPQVRWLRGESAQGVFTSSTQPERLALSLWSGNGTTWRQLTSRIHEGLCLPSQLNQHSQHVSRTPLFGPYLDLLSTHAAPASSQCHGLPYFGAFEHTVPISWKPSPQLCLSTSPLAHLSRPSSHVTT